MNLYIRIENGRIVDHPVYEDNLKMFIPDLDPANPPDEWARFVRVPFPEIKFTEILENTTYELSNYLTVELGTQTYTDVHHVRTLTEQELEDKLVQFYGKTSKELGGTYDLTTGLWQSNNPTPNPGSIHEGSGASIISDS